jgi:hypothetical protein
MRHLFKLAAGAAALCVAAPAAAQPVAPGAFAASEAGTLAEQLVLCDLSRYFQSDPNTDANVIYVRRDIDRFEARIPPYVSWGGSFYDEDLERAYRRYRSAGALTLDQVSEAQRRYTRAMTRTFERGTLRDRNLLRAQGDFCEGLVRNAPRW